MRQLLLLILISSASILHAAPARKRAWFSGLADSVSSYLNAPTVRKATTHAAVAAVRGGIPTDQGENLDLRLLDRARLLRQRLLAAPEAADEAALRRIYQALAVSQWVQALEKDSSSAVMAQETTYAIRAWAGQQEDLSPQLKRILTGPAKALGGDALVAAGWGTFCRALTPESAASAASAPGRAAASEVAELDEMLKSLLETLDRKSLAPAQAAKAHQLAGQVYEKLAQADLPASQEIASSGGKAPAIILPSASARSSKAPSAPAEEFSPRKIYGNAAKAVVLIICADKDGSGELGSGSILDDSGRILTNAHVVIRDSTRKPWPIIRVYLKPAKMTGDPKRDMTNPMDARVVSWDASLDLALIEPVSPISGMPHLSLADPEDVVIGDRVAAIGHPEQGGLWTLTTGVVSTLIADLGGVTGKKAFQTDTSINRGNSGGPLLNAAGDIIGVNTLMSRKASDGLAITAVNFAVRSDIARSWLAGATMPVAYATPASPAVPAAAAADAEEAAAPPPPPAKGRDPKHVTVTESRPFDREKLIEEEIKEMEDMGDEMHEDIMKRKHKP